MASDSHGKRAAFESLDRISNLPKEVIDEILHRMPIRDAIKTSLLSSRWRYRWTSMYHLVFDKRSIPPNEGQQQQMITNNLVNFVNKALFLHNDRISKFELNQFLQTCCSDIDQWILVLSRKDLHHLVLRFKKQTAYQLPACLFSCRSLRSFQLGGCILNLPSKFQGFSYLTILRLSLVNLTNETFEILVLKIPLLRVLYISNCKRLTRVNIHAPNLEVFVIDGRCERINFRTSQKVKRACINISPPGFPPRCKLNEVLGPLNAVQSLRICHPFLEISPMRNVPERLEAVYHHLKHVKLLVNFENSKEILATLWLCRSAPLLSRLKIFAVWDREGTQWWYEDNFWEAQLRKEDNVLHHLETVILDGFKGLHNDMGFTQFIMLNALVLERLSINWEESAPVDEKLRVVEKMMQCPRASTNAKVVFNTKA